jgi:hypothetical protein
LQGCLLEEKKEFESIAIDIMHFAPEIKIESEKDTLPLAALLPKNTQKIMMPIIDRFILKCPFDKM